jgi:hypothetical protein
LALNQVWIETQDHGLVRADQVVEVLAHQTTAFSGKPARWLLDVVIAVSQGAGTTSQWNVGASHRTLAQTGDEPHGAAQRLVRLLCQLDTQDAAGVVTVRRDPATIKFGFDPFAAS